MAKKKEKKKEGGGIGELLAYAGDRRCLTYLGMGLSAVSQLLSFGPYVCIWFVARDLIAVAPNWSEAAGIATYGWWAVGFALASIVVYFAGLMCTHLAAFRCASNIRKATSEHLLKLPLGYFDVHATGELRRLDRDPARAHAPRHLGRCSYGCRPARAARCLRLAPGRGLPHLGCHINWRHGDHDERQGRRVHESLYGRARAYEQDRY